MLDVRTDEKMLGLTNVGRWSHPVCQDMKSHGQFMKYALDVPCWSHEHIWALAISMLLSICTVAVPFCYRCAATVSMKWRLDPETLLARRIIRRGPKSRSVLDPPKSIRTLQGLRLSQIETLNRNYRTPSSTRSFA